MESLEKVIHGMVRGVVSRGIRRAASREWMILCPYFPQCLVSPYEFNPSLGANFETLMLIHIVAF
jgi:hypothetical protein